MSMKRVLLSLTAVGALGFASTAQAQNVEFAATTTGCFYLSPGTCTPTTTADLFGGFSLGGMTFHSGGFDDFTNGNPVNELSIGGGAQNFGYFDVGNVVHTPTALQKFKLNVTFTLPFIIGDPTARFTAVVSGGVTLNKAKKVVGGYDVILDNPLQNFTYFGPDFQGSFSLLVENTHTTHGGLGQIISGRIITQASSITPEPATIALFATGLIGLVPFARRRRNRA
jgi:hypothetical protein